MLHGIGTDIVEVARVRESLERMGQGFAWRILGETERPDFLAASEPARFLAKRFAAKEAFGKALGTGIRAPATLHSIGVTHDPLGRPGFVYFKALEGFMHGAALSAHLSISDERQYVIAFAVIEKT
ncbi:holo-ACP synthase [Cognatazoarcus halotolerans]|uniref:holo-ACP synthase n=1 Tax=Cognatazoarcus halotolerans TaxID=2686016 RepID=UPI0013593EC8|nr:holo-ACP synthase [Cognatazoarcus halotolerans]MBX3679133.1 holo-ACP synthase [Rhodocyclaceae bacterium]MCB1898073.1 holo-ACP synthase [Rhodocyclaceae bacterium]MCP5309235.1 holo-ACP synthase [Zoogloeaceae bacterium]